MVLKPLWYSPAPQGRFKAVMKRELDHLPDRKRKELDAIVQSLFDAFEEGHARIKPKGGRRAGGRIVKIILFGSYARGTWVDDPHTKKGYRSDFDILVLVDKDYLAQEPGLFKAAEDRFHREEFFQTPVQIIIDTWQEVNSRIANGDYFFVDIAKEGIALYEFERKDFSQPRQLTGDEAYGQAKAYFERVMPKAKNFLDGCAFYQQRGDLHEAAFLLHQAVEHAYGCYLLVKTAYLPATHNLSALRSFCEDRDERFHQIWPKDTRLASRAFQRLKRAYVDARYSEHFEITEEELDWLKERVQALHELVRKLCEDRLLKLASTP